VISIIISILKGDEIMFLRHGLLLDVIFTSAHCGTIGCKTSQPGYLIVDRSFGGLSNLALSSAGWVTRRGLFERRDDSIYIAYALALRRHEAH
jgi:hypothetical protein